MGNRTEVNLSFNLYKGCCSVRLTWDVFVRDLNRQLGTPPTGYLWIPAKKDKRAP